MSENYKTLLDNFTEWLETLGFSTSMVYNCPKTTAYFLAYLEQNGVQKIEHLTPKLVYEYFDHLQQRKSLRSAKALSTAHLNKSFDAIDKFLEFLHQMGMTTAPSPTKYRLLNPYKADFEILTPAEITDLYNTIQNTFLKYALASREPRQAILTLVLDLLYGCGLRRSEVTNLQIKDVNFNRKVLHIRQAKGYKDRYVPMSKKVYQNIQNFVFTHRKYFNRRPSYLFPYTSHYIPKALEILLRETSNHELKTKRLTPHSFRHSIATHLLQNGMSIESIAKFLGHSSLESTQIYTHIINDL